MKIQLSVDQLTRLFESDTAIEAELTNGVMANYAHQLAKRVSLRVLNQQNSILSNIEREFIGSATWKSQELLDKWKTEIARQISVAIEGEISNVLTAEFISNRLRSSFEGYVTDRMESTLRNMDIPGKVRKAVQDAVASELSGNLKITVGGK